MQYIWVKCKFHVSHFSNVENTYEFSQESKQLFYDYLTIKSAYKMLSKANSQLCNISEKVKRHGLKWSQVIL